MEEAISSLLVPTLSVGAAGGLAGAILGVARHQNVAIYALSTSVNCSIMGGSFFTLRKVGTFLYPTAMKTRTGRVGNAAVAGAVTGACYSAILRGSRGLLSAVAVYGALGGAGEYTAASIEDWTSPKTAEQLEQKRLEEQQKEQGHETVKVKESEKSVWTKLMESTPLRKMPDAEFESMMRGKIQDLDDQIKLTDEAIAATKTEISNARKTESSK